MPVVAAVVEHPGQRLLNVGFAARPTYGEALKKAWTEALTLQTGSRDMLRADSNLAWAIGMGLIGGGWLKPFRSDRRYLNDFRSDFRDINELAAQQQYYLDARAREPISHLIDVHETEAWPGENELVDRSLEQYQKMILERGYGILVAEVTTPDVLSAGLHVVRVIIPGLVANFAAALPMLGHGRLQAVPHELGLVERP